MRKSIGVAIPLALILLAFLGFIACTTGPSNVNRDVANAANGSAPAALTTDPCTEATLALRLSGLQTKFHDPNLDTGDSELNAQHSAKKFEIKIEPDPTWGIAMRVRGKIGKDDSTPKLRKLINFVDKHIKKGCVQRVSFESMTASASGFEWTICEDPARPCPPPDGACGMCMLSPTPGVNANSNTNGNSNPNPNVNANTNANANRSSNSSSGP